MRVSENDTISDLVTKLNNIGVNHGYSSKPMVEYSQEVVTNYADGNTKLSELGVTVGRIEVRDNSNNSYYVYLESDDTIQDLINVLDSEGISASISDGFFLLIMLILLMPELLI